MAFTRGAQGYCLNETLQRRVFGFSVGNAGGALTFLEEKMNEFGQWLSPDELEKKFWETADEIHSKFGLFETWHARRPANKLRNEILPIHLFAKSRNGHPNGVGFGLRVYCNIDDYRTLDGQEYDAKYRWHNFQPSISPDRLGGFIEVTRCVTSVPDERFIDREIVKGNIPTLPLRNTGVSGEYKKLVLCRASKKAQMDYPENTTLILHLDDQTESPIAANWLAEDREFLSKLERVLEPKFSAFFLCAMSAGNYYHKLGSHL